MEQSLLTRRANLRLKAKAMITMVHGFAVYMHILPDDTANGPDEPIEPPANNMRRDGGAALYHTRYA